MLTPPVGPDDHARGPDRASLTLVEYGDYQCPDCQAAFWVVEKVLSLLGDRLRFVYRHFPLSSQHPQARSAAEAAEACAAQGLFWPMYDRLFRHPSALSDEDLIAHAVAVGAEEDDVRSALADGTFMAAVKADFHSGVRSGVNGTPTFFINGIRFDGPSAVDDLLAALEAALSSERGSP